MSGGSTTGAERALLGVVVSNMVLGVVGFGV